MNQISPATAVDNEGRCAASPGSPRGAVPLIVFPVAVTVFFAAVSVAWLPSSTIEFSTDNFIALARILAMLILLRGIAWAVIRRFRDDPSPIAGFVRRSAEGLSLLVKAGVIFAPFAHCSGLYMYLASNTSAPLMDAQLVAIDAALGFHWLTFLGIANASSLVSTVLVGAYHSTGMVLAATMVYLSVSLRESRLMELLALLALTSLCTGVLMALVPAAGAYAWFQPSREVFSNFTENAGMWHYTELRALRSGAPFTYLTAQSSGLVTFPSFHTVLGVIISYAVRGIPYVALVVIPLNVVMIVATLPEGGHYLIDVIAGLVIGLTSIVIVRFCSTTRRLEHR